MALEEKRAQLQGELDAIFSRLCEIKNELFSDAGYSRLNNSGGVATFERTATGRSLRGALKLEILRALTAAGADGVKVKELAATLGVKSTNIHSWFQTSGKRVPQIVKIGEAHYRLEGEIPAEQLEGLVRKKSGFGGVRRSTRPHSGRGVLAAKVVAALTEAGPEGMKVRDIADKIGMLKHKNLFIWFATTGKKNAAIKKVGEARYAIGA